MKTANDQRTTPQQCGMAFSNFGHGMHSIGVMVGEKDGTSYDLGVVNY